MTTVLRIHGLDCADEVAELRAALQSRAGVSQLSFDVLRGLMFVEHDESRISRADLIVGVAHIGMRAEVWHADHTKDADAGETRRRLRLWLTTLSGILLAAAFVTHGALAGWLAAFGADSSQTPGIVIALNLAATVLGVSLVVPKAWSSLLRARLDMNVLMLAAIAGAIGLGEFSEAATVAFLFALSLVLEGWSFSRARRAVEALMQLAPDTACVLQAAGTETIMPASEVPVGSTLVVRPGDKFPLDGRVTRGETSVNQAPITGESLPVVKRPGDDVFAGTINQDGAIEVLTTKAADDSTLARIVRLVADAQRKRSPAEQWVETFARYYTPTVMGLAVAIMLLPPLLAAGSWGDWFYQGLVLLVIACPCALVISTPVSMVAALASAARQGVLVKGASYLEVAARLRAVAFDKTGTLTEGRPEVTEVVALSGHDEREVLDIAAAIESRSQHPLAAAIVRYAESHGVRATPADAFQSLPGQGATALLSGQRYWIGSHRAFELRGQETPELHERLEQLGSRGHSVVIIANDEHVCGLIALGDTVRANAKESLAALHRAGIRHLVMLTGDNRSSAATIGDAAGVDDIRAELLPEAKVAAIEELLAEHGQVGMVGDG
ncbi:MAG: cadmium-translocating P-type ATPase, partial [Planctomycetaceae bacterium]|nr:cadmium-translocating P-type ATPase [Planctomycetaceae bacterium]